MAMSKAFYYTGIVVVAALVVLGTLPRGSQTETDSLKKFASYDELKSFIETRSEDYAAYRSLGGADMIATRESMALGAPQATMADSSDSSKSSDYSSTNIQVEGVDEADIIKNDGKYIYTVSGNKVVIIDAYPAGDMKIVSEINVTGVSDIFVNGDRLVVFGSDYTASTSGASAERMIYHYFNSQTTFANIYDISDRKSPTLAHNVSADGSYVSSRMIGNHVYMIINEPVTQDVPVPALRGTTAFPDIYYFDVPGSSYNYINVVAIDVTTGEANNKAFLVPYSENLYVSKDNVYLTYTKWLDYRDFFDKFVDEVIVPAFPELSSRITEIRSYNLGRTAQLAEIQETLEAHLRGMNPEQAAAAQKAGEQNMVKFQTEIAKEREKTVIHKISISGMEISYVNQGSVPGRPLNQFSMDEHNGNFRIATTVSSGFGPVIMTASAGVADAAVMKPATSAPVSSEMPAPDADTTETIAEPVQTIAPPAPRSSSLNNLYVLDSGMNIVGKLEDLAPGERIYSTRFMADRAYMVTFRQIDPLFVIDLSSEPKLLGQLKITGVSQYIHPVNSTHIIGVGKEATEQGFFQGLKMSLFDVSDVANPKEVSKFVIGDRGTESQVLYDHKAFLYSQEKNLLVLPVMIAEIDRSKYQDPLPTWAYGEPKWQGVYVFNIGENGFKVAGRVTHATNETDNYQFYYSEYTVSRALYIGDALYTMSGKLLKANSLDSMEEISLVELPGTDYRIYDKPMPL